MRRLMIKIFETSPPSYYLTTNQAGKKKVREVQPLPQLLLFKTITWKPLWRLGLWALAAHSPSLAPFNKCWAFLNHLKEKKKKKKAPFWSILMVASVIAKRSYSFRFLQSWKLFRLEIVAFHPQAHSWEESCQIRLEFVELSEHVTL